MRRRSRPEPSPLPQLAGFTEVAEIGSGAFATVFRARELDTNRLVALKVLRLADTRPQALETFRQETLAHGSVSSHPHILTLYRSFALGDGRPVLVLELCEGSLGQRVRRDGPLSPEVATSVGIKVAGALESAHRAGLLHRDVKPQNVLVTSYGEPVLADFGIAQLQAASQGTEGVFGFTTLHAPPEVLEGRPVGPATDVYELASTLYQLITGRAAFAAFDGEAPASVILRILRDPVAPLVRADVPLSLSDLLLAALAKDPADRPTSALELAEGLQAVQRDAGWAPTTPAVLGAPSSTDHPAAPAGAAAPPTHRPPPPPPPGPQPATAPPPPPGPRPATAPPPPPEPVPPPGAEGPAGADAVADPAPAPGRIAPPTARRTVVDPTGAPGAPTVPPVRQPDPTPAPGAPGAPVRQPGPTPAPGAPGAPAAPARLGPSFVMPSETTSRPSLESPYERTALHAGAAGRFERPGPVAGSDRSRPRWVLPAVAAALGLVVLVLVLVLS